MLTCSGCPYRAFWTLNSVIMWVVYRYFLYPLGFQLVTQHLVTLMTLGTCPGMTAQLMMPLLQHPMLKPHQPQHPVESFLLFLLPPFWSADSELWLDQVEAQFADNLTMLISLTVIEVLAIYLLIKHFRYYVEGCQFYIYLQIISPLFMLSPISQIVTLWMVIQRQCIDFQSYVRFDLWPHKLWRLRNKLDTASYMLTAIS